jgi:hypothetical protein
MPEMERYLEQIRAHLDVNPRRAHEIIAEARSHLEARARQFEGKGMSREEAVAQAVRGFGEPHSVAEELTKANAKHREAGVLRPVLGIGLAFGTTLSAISCLAFLHQRGATLWGPGVVRALTVAYPISATAFALPGAILAGMAAGRRYWWVAATPPIVFMAVCWALSLAAWRLVPYDGAVSQLILALAWPFASAGAFAGCGYLGARVAERPRTCWVVGIACAVYSLGIAPPALAQAVNNLGDVVLVVAVAQGVACLLLLAAHRDRLVSHCVLMTAGVALTALAASLTAAAIAASRGGQTYSGEGRAALIVALASAIYMPAALVWFGRKARRVSEAAHPAEGRPRRAR